MQSFAEFRIPSVILYGCDSFAKIGEQVSLLGKKALLISDGIMEKIGNTSRCQKFLEQAGLTHVSYLGVHSEPTDLYVEEALEIFIQEKCDVIVGLGGGSCLDAAKAVAVLAANEGYIGDYTGGRKPIKRKPVPLIAVPTTAGTGSEVTSVTVITNTKEDVKMMIKDPAFIPTVAIVDPVLTLTSPPQVTAATGLDALCHAVEAYISRRAQPMTDMLALSAIELISQHLHRAYKNGQDMEARESMALAAMKAGMAFTNASVCLVHGMSRPIGAVFHVPHGISNAMLLPAVLEFSKNSCMERLAVIGRIFNDDLEAVSDEKAATEAIVEIKKLCLHLNIPNIKKWGIDPGIFARAVEKMAADAIDSGSPANNPRVPAQEEIAALYDICYDYDFSNLNVQ
ncbi:iron-containing alcohol dehydrogenase [Paenactinomyces guangxiensis]|uniref:Iron-containing alcohol dehydrogenase n=1 Tax=Paenactinomyces guangxiensis TaxID=1490290 RepID=A0A7W2A9G0_9BACL|nr:iron-containing alcohol dehydrogenase [Paenactinomyces guangxiensis]MBA4495214.1 iron-containing alcohol dehydrogenase [Paenactinomyces guangxiensis]MBH8592298.1 iron-containing alcohol dehydrogenase [Paenactinomyces guangxiensis]